MRLFLRDQSGRRPYNGTNEMMQSDPHWRDHLLFHEYFHGENGTGLGASHQTGWTGLVAMLIQQQRVHRDEDPMGISSAEGRRTSHLDHEIIERS